MIPSTIVENDYEPNPNDERLLTNGTYLKDGMVVLINDKDLRIDTTRPMSTYRWMKALDNNRWFEVTDVSSGDGIVHFQATYADGMKKTRWVKIDTPWIVRLDSM